MTHPIWQQLINGPNSATMLRASSQQVAYGLTKLLGQTITSSIPEIRQVAVEQLSRTGKQARSDEVGVYLKIESELGGAALVRCRMSLVDLLAPPTAGTPAGLGPLQRSALAEVGNLMLAYFLNALAELSANPSQLFPSPPIVAVDMLRALLNVMLTAPATSRGELLLIETLFNDMGGNNQLHMWVLPNLAERG